MTRFVFSVLPAPDSPLPVRHSAAPLYSRNEKTLVLLCVEHVAYRAVCDRKNVRRIHVTSLVAVRLDRRVRIYRQHMVRVHRHQEEAGVGLR